MRSASRARCCKCSRMASSRPCTLRALKKSFFGDAISSVRMQEGRVTLDADWNEQQSITAAEKTGACLLMFATLAVGLYPKFLLDRIMPAVEAMRCLK